MTGIDAAVAAKLAGMPLARLAHFTPSKNLPHILGDSMLRSVQEMAADVRSCYTATDLARFDGYRDRVCCSFQYPNGYYFADAKAKYEFVNCPDWCCLLINKMVAATEGTLFCPRNAASSSAVCTPGVAGLDSCYAPSVTGQGGKTRFRGPLHDPGSPTDVQAEILVTAPIPLSEVSAIVVPSEAAARQEYGRLIQFGLQPPQHVQWKISPNMFKKYKIANAVGCSVYFAEVPWAPTGTDSTR